MKNLLNKPLRVVLCLALLSLFACDKNRVYEENKDIEESVWKIESEPAFDFEITDNTKPYNVKINIRNMASYPYYNIYVTYYLLDAEGKELTTAMKEFTLMDPKTGEPQGSGMGDIFDNQFDLLTNYKFPKNGKYTVRYKQYMRQDPLPAIMSLGLRVETAE